MFGSESHQNLILKFIKIVKTPENNFWGSKFDKMRAEILREHGNMAQHYGYTLTMINDITVNMYKTKKSVLKDESLLAFSNQDRAITQLTVRKTP